MNHVIIIGAGASGLAAASRLADNGLSLSNITILEAQNRIGGRIHTLTNDGAPFELGAQWVHGQEGNVVFEMGKAAQELNTDIHTLQSSGFAENVVFAFEDHKVTQEQTRELMHLLKTLKDNSGNELFQWENSLGEYFENRFVEELNSGSLSTIDHSTSMAFLDWYHLLENVIDGSDSWKETCGSGHLHYRECPGDPLVTWKRGCSALFDILMKKLPKRENGDRLPLSDRIFLNKAVMKIEWDSKQSSTEFDDREIQVVCEDGSRFQATFVLVTTSLGFLKKNADKIFTPILPPFKRRAIKGLGYGTVDKIFLKFAKPWWPQEWGGISFLRRRSEQSAEEKPWSNHILGFYTVRLQPNFLIGWITGKAAREVETLSEHEIRTACSDLLKKYVGSDFAYKEPTEVLCSTWFSNPFTLGSYSYRSMESKAMNVWASDLAQPIYDSKGHPRLFFAGEATHDHFYSTVHGAVESGWREGDRIAKYSNALRNSKL